MADETFGVQQIADHAKKPIGYHVIDRQTGAKVGRASTLRGASRSVDRRDNAYGGYRYTHRPIYEGDE